MTDVDRLQPLDQSTLTLAEGERDLRGRLVFDVDGVELGRIESLYVDPVQRKLRFLLVQGGGVLGIDKDSYLIPTEAIRTIDEGQVQLGRSRQDAQRAPVYDPRLTLDTGYWRDVYDAYGYAPYWSIWPRAIPPRRY